MVNFFFPCYQLALLPLEEHFSEHKARGEAPPAFCTLLPPAYCYGGMEDFGRVLVFVLLK
jgi:hypothetical protein